MNPHLRSHELLSLLGIAATPLVLAGLGWTHPHDLTRQTASYWYTLHYILLSIFPLLGVNLWWLLANIPGVWAWLARLLVFVYIPFYGGLDVLAGMGTGFILKHAQATNQPALAAVNSGCLMWGMSLQTWADGHFCLPVF